MGKAIRMKSSKMTKRLRTRQDKAHHKADSGQSATMTPEKLHDEAHYGFRNINATGSISTPKKCKERLDEDDKNTEARRLMKIQFDKIKSGTSETFTLCHKKLIKSDAEYCSELETNFSLKELKFRNCNVDGKFLLAIQKNIPKGKVEHVNFSGNKQIYLPTLKNLMAQWECKSFDLSNIEFDEKKMNDLRRIPLETLILNYSSFPVTSNALKHVAELLQSLEKLSLVSSTISTNQLVLIADHLSDGIKLQSLNLSHVQLEDGGLMAVCKIINKTKGMKKLSLSNSGLTAGKLEVFSIKVTQEIEELNLGLNRNIGPTDLERIIEIVKSQHVRKLNLTGLALNQQALKQLIDSGIQITELNISENSRICISDIGDLAAKLKIQNLDISECWLRVDDLKKLPISMKNHKLHWIDVTDSCRVLNEERRKEILSSLSTIAEEVRLGY